MDVVRHGPNFKDLTGKRFGRLEVIEYEGKNKNKQVIWKCKCDCGNSSSVIATKLLTGRTKSCGCLRKELSSERATRHGMYGTRLYDIWANMIQRCTNPKSTSYQYYGAKGVTVCDSWKDFSNFAEWAQCNGYTDDLSIDRIDSDGDYTPMNCRWVNAIEQGNNKGNNLIVEHDGKTYTAAEIARTTGEDYFTVRSRIKRGWSGQRLLGRRD